MARRAPIGRPRGRRRTEQLRTQSTAPGKWARGLKNPFAPIEILSLDELDAIRNTAHTILEEIGIRVLNTRALEFYSMGGASVDHGEGTVRLDRAMVEEVIKTAPSRLTLRARNDDRQFDVGGNRVAFMTVGGAPNINDIEHGRRPGTLGDFNNLMRLAQSFDCIHLLGPAVEPQDLPVPDRHLDMTLSMMTMTDKFPFVYARGQRSLQEGFEIVRIANGLSHEAFAEQPRCYTIVNSNSPLQLDDIMCQGIIMNAEQGQLMILTPFTLAGAMAPVTLAGALAQQHAEALAGITIAQLVRPGAAVAYGGFTSNVDMRSGAPAFGTPEYVKAAFASGQLARLHNLPFRSSNVTASNCADAQAAYEAQMSIWGALMGGCNILAHGAGWLESGLCASYEKFILDIEMLQMMAEVFEPLPVDDFSLALDAVREVGSGGHFFGAAHTLQCYDKTFYEPLVSDRRNFESWQEAGSETATDRAHRIWKKVVAEFEPPAMDVAVRDELNEFVDRHRTC